jgi:hypothetical protein
LSLYLEVSKAVEKSVLSDIPRLYPRFNGTKPELVEFKRKKSRWSEHYIFTFSGGGKLPQVKILAKVMRDRDTNGRSQEENTPEQQRAKYEFQALESIYQAVRQERIQGLTAIRPLTYNADFNFLTLEYVPGQNFLALMQEAGKLGSNDLLVQQANNVAIHSGRLLGAIHKIPRNSYPTARTFDFGEYQHLLKMKIDLLVELGVNRKKTERLFRAGNILGNLVAKKNNIVTYGFLHNDYYPENIVQGVNGDVYTIDTTLLQVGPVEQDIAKFLIGVELSKRRLLYGSLGMKDSLPITVQQSFLNGYQEQNKYNHAFLGLMKILAALQRWIEILEIVRFSRFALPGGLFIKLRIAPVMLAYLESTMDEIRKRKNNG